MIWGQLGFPLLVLPSLLHHTSISQKKQRLSKEKSLLEIIQRTNSSWNLDL
jgi:hypothetical protein